MRWMGAVAMIFVLGGSVQAAPAGADAAGRALIEELAAGRFDAVVARFDATMTSVLPASKLKWVWGQLTGQAGAFVKIERATAQEQGGYHVALVDCAFAHGRWQAKVAIDKAGKVAGLFFHPLAAPWSPPEYGRAPVDEQAVTVGPLALPGTLTLPRGAGPFPAVVLVHGSGPQDEDETIGPNKPFADLALGLAAHGVATLRYEKRTRRAPQAFTIASHYTVKEEVIDDARAAVALLAGPNAPAHIDRRRVFVLGHSLGGTLAPRIATGDPDVAGVVILAGATRPLETLMIEQMKLLSQDPKAIAAVEAAARHIRDPKLEPGDTVEVLGATLPGSYWLDLRAYDPVRAIEALTMPVFVLQGERDYQVLHADYEGWVHALAGRPGAELKTYRTLNHLFMAGSGPSSPAEYERPGHVDAQVIADIAAFVNGTRK